MRIIAASVPVSRKEKAMVYMLLAEGFEGCEALVPLDLLRRAGVEVSVGFDGHRICDYLPERVKDYCRQIEQMGIRMPFEELK